MMIKVKNMSFEALIVSKHSSFLRQKAMIKWNAFLFDMADRCCNVKTN
jgi:hypothetical protein